MSLFGMRAAIAAALVDVDGVQCYRYRPDSLATGDAWPVRGPAERDQVSGLFLLDWGVQVCLPPDAQSADQWIDDHIDDVVAGLSPVAYVSGFVGVKLTTDEYGLELQLRSE